MAALADNAQTPSSGYEGIDSSSPRTRLPLPPSQPVLRHLVRVGSRGARWPSAVRYRQPIRWDLLREDARGLLPVPSPVPAQDSSPSAAVTLRSGLQGTSQVLQ